MVELLSKRIYVFIYLFIYLYIYSFIYLLESYIN